MSLTGLFKAVCYDSLTSYGFKYKNRTFYRIHGDGMFQAISVWDRTHYEINAVNAPIWSLEDKIHLYVCELCGKRDFSWVEGELERREQYGRKIIKYVLGEKALG